MLFKHKNEFMHAFCAVSALLQYVLRCMFIGGDPMIQSVNMREPLIIELKKKVTHALSQALIPLQAYAAEFEQFLELQNLDIQEFIQ